MFIQKITEYLISIAPESLYIFTQKKQTFNTAFFAAVVAAAAAMGCIIFKN